MSPKPNPQPDLGGQVNHDRTARHAPETVVRAADAAGGWVRSGWNTGRAAALQGDRQPAGCLARRPGHECGALTISTPTDRAETMVVLAKEPVPGRVKTRLQADFSAEDATELAACAIEDTLHALGASRAPRKVLAPGRQPVPVKP